jgi:hypothetical protein
MRVTRIPGKMATKKPFNLKGFFACAKLSAFVNNNFRVTGQSELATVIFDNMKVYFVRSAIAPIVSVPFTIKINAVIFFCLVYRCQVIGLVAHFYLLLINLLVLM